MAGIGTTRLKAILWQALGYGFLVLGVLGMFLPILQGFLFLAIGLIILARHAPWAERLLNYLREKSPTLDRTVALAEAKTHEWQHRAQVQWYQWRSRAVYQARLWRTRMAGLVRRG
jgi:Putative transmembrane protein (PGPGW)